MSFASIGFVITQLIKSDFYFKNCYDKFFIGVGSLVLLRNNGINQETFRT